ncbi:GNAT family N-acetyltransferase [candidate division WOR-3 bacterium]|nr:GNAT family N-acetyltransferase [candidate division WOR-3 bacterium]
MIVRRMQKGEAEACEQVMRSLPKLFGIEEAIVEYAQACETMETYVGVESGRVVGFVTLNQRSPVAAEIHCMALRPEFHGKGLGRALVDHVEGLLASRPIEFLQVKTLGPARPNAEYERTRGFYEHMGFRPLEENDLWGKDNPCLMMVKHLTCPRPSRAGQ